MTALDKEIVGRDGELAALAAFLEADGPARALVIEGEAGIGKTTLWRAAVATAESSNVVVLSSSPAQSESQLAFAALGDLLEPVLDDVLPALPAPQRRALDVVLLREDASDAALDPRTIGIALLSSVRLLARHHRVLVAIDDVQWLDASSAAAVEFMARRLRHERAALLFTHRLESDSAFPLDLGRFGAETLRLAPITLGALHRLLRTRLDVPLPRNLLRRVHELTAGNPLFALELALLLRARGVEHVAPGVPLPVPATLTEVLRERVAEIPKRARDALLLCAATSHPTLDLLNRALRTDTEKVLAPAVENGIVRVAGDTIRFVHPLFADTVYDDAAPSSRRRAHRQLALACSDPEQRARQLALSTAGWDAELALLLDEAALAAGARGAPAAAAELFEQALAKTQPDDVYERARRSVSAADALMRVGDRRRARALLEAATSTLDAGPLRSDALALLSDLVADDAEGGEKSRALIEQSLHEAGEDPRRRAEALLRLDLWERSDYRLADALQAAREAVALAEESGDDHLLCRALTRKVDLEVVLGLAEDPPAHFRRALELDRKLRVDPLYGPPSMLAVCLVRAGRVDEARPLLLAQHRRTIEEGNDEARILLCLFLAELEWLAGQWARAADWAHEGLELAEQCEARLQYGALLSVLALVEASCGAVDAARIHADEGLALCESLVERSYALQNRCALGFLELSLGNAGAAHEHLGRMGTEGSIEGTKRISFIGDEIEALVRLGDTDRAAKLVDELERRGRQLYRETLLGVAARGRALLLACGGDAEAAVGPLRTAVEVFASLGLPFERSRTLLVLGEVLRRAKQKRAARAALEEALTLFDGLGATLWADKARAELARIGGRTRADGLTPTEQRIADLVSEGRSNKEIAAALFVTVKTVERNLTRIYRKLGIRSRVQLAGRVPPG